MLSGRLGPRARWIVTDRHGGRSRAPYAALNLADHVGDDPAAVAANRATAAGLLGVAPERVVHMAPVHGREVAVVGPGTTSPVPGVDALVPTAPGTAVAAMAADCVPVLLAGTSGTVVAAVHAGWLGVRDDVVGAAVESMLAAGAGRVVAVLGPAVCGSCYPVPQDRVDQVAAVVPQAAARSASGDPSLDLRAGLVARLRALDVETSVVGGCTVEDADLFSHRRDGVTGRHGAFVVLEADAGADADGGTLGP